MNRRSFLGLAGKVAAVSAVPVVAVASESRQISEMTRDGIGAVVIGGEMVVYDGDDFRLRHGDRAVVLKGRVITVDRIVETDKTESIRAGYLFSRPDRAAYVNGPEPGSVADVRVLGRVIGRKSIG